MKKLFSLLLVAAMCIMMFAGCGTKAPAETTAAPAETTAAPAETTAASDETTAAPAAAGTIKIGMSGPLTGGASAYGIAVKTGMEIAVEEINALGGVQIEFMSQDDQADPTMAVDAYNALKDWGMQIFAGNVTSGAANAVAPGYIGTDMTNVLSDKVKDAMKAQIPAKRIGTPDDVANVVAFLCSDEAAYVTGEVIRVDGGLAM